MALHSRVGELLVGKYRLEQRLGSGGVGEVYLARNEMIGRVVAIKTLREERASESIVVRRFMQEAKAANLVKHPNVVDVLDVDQDKNGIPFIVQEFLAGKDLGQHLRDHDGQIPYDELLGYMIPIADAVATAHKHGVVHRDLKPENVFLARINGTIVPKLLDFGISYIQPQPNEIRMTREGTTVGTPAYMAPEQVEGTDGIDGRTDIWAIGVILYEALAGRLPFDGETPAMLFAQIAWVSPTHLLEVAPSTPPALADVIMRCLERAPSDRYQHAHDLVRDLNLVQNGQPLDFGERPTAVPSPAPKFKPDHVESSTPPPRMQAPSLVMPMSTPPGPDDRDESIQDELLAPLDQVPSSDVPQEPSSGDAPSSGLQLKTIPPPGAPPSGRHTPTSVSSRQPERTMSAGAASVDEIEVAGLVRAMVLAGSALAVVGLWHVVVDSNVPSVHQGVSDLVQGTSPGLSLLFGFMLAVTAGWLVFFVRRQASRWWSLLLVAGGMALGSIAFFMTLGVTTGSEVSKMLAVAAAISGMGGTCAAGRQAWSTWAKVSRRKIWQVVLFSLLSGTAAFVGLLIFRSLL